MCQYIINIASVHDPWVTANLGPDGHFQAGRWADTVCTLMALPTEGLTQSGAVSKQRRPSCYVLRAEMAGHTRVITSNSPPQGCRDPAIGPLV
jgi:hypothetical protein